MLPCGNMALEGGSEREEGNGGAWDLTSQKGDGCATRPDRDGEQSCHFAIRLIPGVLPIMAKSSRFFLMCKFSIAHFGHLSRPTLTAFDQKLRS